MQSLVIQRVHRTSVGRSVVLVGMEQLDKNSEEEEAKKKKLLTMKGTAAPAKEGAAAAVDGAVAAEMTAPIEPVRPPA